MKVIYILTLLHLLISSSAYCRTCFDKILGEWMLEISDDGDWFPDVIIIRSDGKYLVFNDFDFIGMPGTSTKFDILMDNQTVTALTEIGKWAYDNDNNQLILKERSFIKDNSLFNEYYGKELELILKVKEITNEKIVLCRNESNCDTYIKNYNPRSDSDVVFYRELTKEFTGHGSQRKEILLSGYETKLTLEFDFLKNSNQLIIEDRSGKMLYSSGELPKNGKNSIEICFRGKTKLVLKVASSEESAKWKIRVGIK